MGTLGSTLKNMLPWSRGAVQAAARTALPEGQEVAEEAVAAAAQAAAGAGLSQEPEIAKDNAQSAVPAAARPSQPVEPGSWEDLVLENVAPCAEQGRHALEY